MLPIYTTKNDKQHGEILFIDGKESICPFKNNVAMPVQNQIGGVQFQIISFPCSTQCPHAWVEQLGQNDVKTFCITCTGITRELELEEEHSTQTILLKDK